MNFLIKEFDHLYNIFHHNNNEICRKPRYVPEFWNTMDSNVKDYTNCYSYAFDKYEVGADKKLQPGELSTGKFGSYDCNEILKKLREDYKMYNIVQVEKHTKLPCNHYKIALVIDDEGDEQDYHFYRQDLDGYWSHKPGKEEVRRVDASGKLITDPEASTANFTAAAPSNSAPLTTPTKS